uniref:PH domain-containing protein n=1 Tax=Cacopsylla melanoneura TaxID=428564 RepID=A0A8D8M879_9HEMI
MANKDDPIEDILRQGFLIKRSQNKKRFSSSNNTYKQRYFVLTTRHLIYYDTDSEDVLGSNGTGMTNLHCLLGIHLLINRVNHNSHTPPSLFVLQQLRHWNLGNIFS